MSAMAFRCFMVDGRVDRSLIGSGLGYSHGEIDARPDR
jgi:hypothetical protein